MPDPLLVVAALYGAAIVYRWLRNDAPDPAPLISEPGRWIPAAEHGQMVDGEGYWMAATFDPGDEFGRSWVYLPDAEAEYLEDNDG